MSYPRTLPVFDASIPLGSWNERMLPGEYAVHDSNFGPRVPVTGSASEPFCTVLGDLDSAEAYARAQVAERPDLRCTIYTHEGRGGAPVRDIRGSQFEGEKEISPRFRRWIGSFLFFGGAILFLVDWASDFRLSWPAMIGARLLIPGLVLLCTEVVIVLHDRQNRRRAADGRTT